MQITLEQTGKRFNYNWIFRNLNYTFNSGNSYAILGPNGSGKSTLLQCICGYQNFSSGNLKFMDNNKIYAADLLFNKISFAAPALELIEEFTLIESINFHKSFKPLVNDMHVKEVIEMLHLENNTHQPVKNFSSGMKQRLKLALTFLSDVPVILLDEPTANLDVNGVDWYLNLIQKYTADKILIICSNDKREYEFCHNRLSVTDYK